MSDLYWLTDEQMPRLWQRFQEPRQTRIGDQRALSGIIFVNRNGLRWRKTPAQMDRTGVLIRMMQGLSVTETEHKTVMINATYLKAQRTASSL